MPTPEKINGLKVVASRVVEDRGPHIHRAVLLDRGEDYEGERWVTGCQTNRDDHWYWGRYFWNHNAAWSDYLSRR